MFNQRRKIYEQIERERNTRVIAYVTSNRQGLETQIGADVSRYTIGAFGSNRQCSKNQFNSVHVGRRYS